MSLIVNEKTGKIKKEIQKIFLRQLYQRLRLVSQKIQEEIRKENIKVWKDHPTYKALLSGQLGHELGFPKGQAKNMVDMALEVLSKSILVVPKLPSRRSAKSGLSVLEMRVFTKAISSDIFQASYATIETEKEAKNDLSSDFGDFGAKKVRKQLHWLEWLLNRGNQYIIFNFKYVDVVSPRSRSGKGLMVYDEKEDWKVPSEYSGTRESNWLTKALQNDSTLPNKYAQIINKHLNGSI